MNQDSTFRTKLLIARSWLSPTKGRVAAALCCSLVVHFALYEGLRYAPAVRIALGLSHMEFVEEDYDRAILIDLSKPLRYPGNYLGFQPPKEALDLEKVKREEERRRRLEAQRKAEREARERAKTEPDAAQKAEPKAEPAPPKPTPSGFRPINTKPIKDQLLRLYEAKQSGRLDLDLAGNLRIGVSGQIKADGSLSDYRVIISSGQEDIDRAALAILAAVSESHAMGPLSELTSLSLILDIGQRAQLTVTGFAPNPGAAAAMQGTAELALKVARISKASDPSAMAMLDNLKVTQSGNRVQAVISMSRQTANELMAKAMVQASAQQ